MPPTSLARAAIRRPPTEKTSSMTGLTLGGSCVAFLDLSPGSVVGIGHFLKFNFIPIQSIALIRRHVHDGWRKGFGSAPMGFKNGRRQGTAATIVTQQPTGMKNQCNGLLKREHAGDP